VATRVQASEDVDIIKKVRGGSLDPSSTIHAVGDKMLIDATKPVSRPYAERIKVPQEVMDRIKLDEWIQEV
jgi:3-polyprenyl-4-hydroxybenzoate decarboxylase